MRSRTRLPLVAAAGLAVAVVVAGCAPVATGEGRPGNVPQGPVFTVSSDIPVLDDVVYDVGDDGTERLLDVCLPPLDEPGATAEPAVDPTVDQPRPAVVLVHGGSWRRGSKSEAAYRSTCQWLARSGFVTFNVDYRLAPDHPFPAGYDDVRAAFEWVRDDAQLERFQVDGERVGAFGASAGGNLVALLATSAGGDGDEADAARPAVVVDLSGPVDLTGRDVTTDFLPVQLSYLGCVELDDCPQAAAASAGTFVDADDPPFFVAHATDEHLIPVAQSTTFVGELREAGVDVTYVEVPGSLHAMQLLDDGMKAAILQFLVRELVDRSPRTIP